MMKRNYKYEKEMLHWLDGGYIEHGGCMTTLRQAAEMALEAMKDFDYDKRMAAIEAVEQALAEPTTESQALRNIYEIWAGSEGIPVPETAVEAYLLRLIEQMRDEASKALAEPEQS